MNSLQFMQLNVRPKIKVLMAHGLGQSGAIFKHKTRQLEQALEAKINQSPTYTDYEIEFFYPDGPLRCLSPDVTTSSDPTLEFSDSFCWSRETDNTSNFDPTAMLTKIASCIKLYGPFDGAICFSQGGLAVALAATLLACEAINTGELEPYSRLFVKEGTNEHIQPPFKFLATFCAPDIVHTKFYPLWTPKVSTPMLQTIGKYDTLVDEPSSRGLASKFNKSQVMVHRGAHFLPRDRPCIDTVVDFIVRSLVGPRVQSLGYFDFKGVPGLVRDEEDGESVNSASSSVATPVTPTMPNVVGETTKAQKNQWRRSSGWQGVGVVRISRTKRSSGFF